MDEFNQSSRGGVWGRLENELLNQARLERQRVSVLGGPVLNPADRPYRNVLVPREFWKALVYSLAGEPRVRAFLVTQDLTGLKQLELDLGEFDTHALALHELEARTQLQFEETLYRADVGEPKVLESMGERAAIRSVSDIEW